MKKKEVHKSRRSETEVKLEMTPMIDVVFQLLAFFVVTFEIQDILSKVEVGRPAPENQTTPTKMPDNLFNVIIYKDGYVLQGRQVTLKEIERQLSIVAKHNPNASIVIRCTEDSPHGYLVQFLDVCAHYNMKDISLFTM